MGIKYNETTKEYEVRYSQRHPLTGVPYSLKRLHIKSKSEANRVYAKLIATVSERLKKAVIPPWEIVLESYLQSLELEDLMNSTRYGRRKILEKYTLERWRGKTCDSITTQDIHDILRTDLSENAEAHKKHFVKCLKGAFQFAVEKGYINRNPTPLLKFKVADKIKSVLTEEQIITLLRRAQELDWPWYPHYAMALYTGMRNGELYALTFDKVNLDLRQILVNSSWSSKDGFKSTKSGDDRIVEIPKPLLPVLTELKLKSLGDNFVLPRLGKWDKGDQARELRFFLKSVGLPEIRFHDLRASWATLLLGKGVAPSKVMSMGGWKDMDTMMIYMRKAGIDIKNSTSVLDSMSTHGVSEAQVIEIRGKV
ncbi:MAG: site-specific integrase [Bdellovibrio sp.]|nr:site-specific integrase [Bdellovibrio sp.]